MKDYERKVEAVAAFHSDEVNHTSRVHVPKDNLYDGATLYLRKCLSRDIVLGNGFFETLTEQATNDLSQELSKLQLCTPRPQPRSLPSVNYLAGVDDRFLDALMQEALPADRERFRKYLSNRPAGVGIITAVSKLSFI